jgi:hypothetical protein
VDDADINSYQKSCRELYNMIPSIVGTVNKRVGTKYISEIAGTGDNTKVRLITLVVAEVLSSCYSPVCYSRSKYSLWWDFRMNNK